MKINWRDEELNPKFLQHLLLFFFSVLQLEHGVALKIERKMSHLNIAFDRSIGTVMHYILVISIRRNGLVTIQF